MPYYQVFLVEYEGLPRYHHAIWVQTSDTGAGFIHHVVGPVENGAMHYERKPTSRSPSKSMAFVRMAQLGCISSDYLQRMDEICGSNQAPMMQLRNGQRLYPDLPLRRCQEWTAETIKLLEKAGVLVQK